MQKQSLYLFIAVLMALIVVLVLGMINNTLVDSVVLFITFIAIMWYAFETRKMRKEMVEQNRLLITPFLLMYYRKKQGQEGCYRVRNLGKGIARNIEFAKDRVQSGDTDIIQQ